jgi:branched-chain amino acid transport system ATP-binding protein
MILEVQGIHTYYGTAHILQGVSVNIGEGETVCLVGRNGAGKTTTFRSIMALSPPKLGTVKFLGEDITGLPPYQVSRKGIAFIPEDRRIFPNLSVRENLEIASIAQKKESPRWTVEKIYEVFPILKKLDQRQGRNLSGGEQQLLCIARGLMSDPKLLLLDEPTEGLAPLIVDSIQDLMGIIRKEVSILLAEQNMTFAYEVSERAYVIDKGVIQFEGSIQDLHENKEVEQKYLLV